MPRAARASPGANRLPVSTEAATTSAARSARVGRGAGVLTRRILLSAGDSLGPGTPVQCHPERVTDGIRHPEGLVNAALRAAVLAAQAGLPEVVVAQRVLGVGGHARVAERDPLAQVHQVRGAADRRAERVGRPGLIAELGDPDLEAARQLAAAGEAVERRGPP